MPTVYKILGQAAPVATTPTVLYTVPGAVQAICSSLIVNNRSGIQGSFRVSVSQGGAATANKDYIYYDLLIGGNDTFIATIGVTLGSGDVIRVYSSTANMSFSVYGSEIT